MNSRGKWVTTLVLVTIVMAPLAACAPAATPEVVEKEVVVEKPVVQTVVVEKEKVVEKPVVETVIVEKEKIVEKPVVETVIVEKEVVVTPTPVPQVLRTHEGTAMNLDPGLSGVGAGHHIMFNLFDGLVKADPETGKVVPDCAESWEASKDLTTWTFHLRDDLVWSDGASLTAHDFEWAWKRNLDPATKAPFSFMLYSLKGAPEFNGGEVTDPDTVGVKALDDRTLEVTCAGACPYLPKVLTALVPMPLPKQAIEEHGDKWTRPENVVVNGPFTLESWVPDKEVVLVPNPRYWGEKPELDRVVYTLIEKTMGACLLSYQAGEVDVCEFDLKDLPMVRQDPVLGKEFLHRVTSRTEWVAFDTSHAPWDDIKVRQAFSLAIDREALSEIVTKGANPPTDTILPPGMPGHNPLAALEGDEETARELLAEAGYPGGEGFPTVEFTFIGGLGTVGQLTAEALQAIWKEELGITTVELNPMEPSAYYAWRRTKKEVPWDIDWQNWGSDYDDPANWHNELFTCQTDFYSTHWCNEEFDDLVSRAMVETNEAKRAKLYEEAEVILVQEAAYVPVWNRSMVFLVKPYVKNLQFERLLNWLIVREPYLAK
jgi:oligopeptide transport system substrate-binding protein